MKNTQEIDKIDVEELMQDFRIQDVEALQIYLKELWKDLSQRSDDKVKGINTVTFSNYYQLPGIILDRLFNLFDKNSNQFIDLDEFIDGMTTLFTENFDNLVKFVFKFYDFDKDNVITKEDIRTVLSYIPLNTHEKYRKDKMKYEKEDFKDRIESQDELQIILCKVFETSDKLDLKGFTDIIENKCSEIFLYLIIFLLEKRPFNKKTLAAYSGLKKGGNNSLSLKSPTQNKKLIASPSLQSKFSPSVTISKSPTINKRNIGGTDNNTNKGNKISDGLSMINKLTGKDDPKNKLLQYANNSLSKGTENKEEEGISKNNPIRRKMQNLKNLEENLKVNVVKENPEVLKSPNLAPVRKYENEGYINIKTDKTETTNTTEDEEAEEIKNEGYLYKITNNKKFKKLWFKQIDKDLYCKYFSSIYIYIYIL